MFVNCMQLSPEAFAIPADIKQSLLDRCGCSSALEILLASPCLNENLCPRLWGAGGAQKSIKIF